MPDATRVALIDDFIHSLGEKFENVFPLAVARAGYIADKYFGAVKTVSDDTVGKILKEMTDSITAHKEHDRIREWKRCCHGVVDYLLRPGDLDGSDGYVHHRIPFFRDFRPTAVMISSLVWGPGILQYEKTGGAITIDQEALTPDGFISLWEFAKGSPQEVLRSENETRALASRILNFICLNNYARVRMGQGAYDHIRMLFANDEHILYRWSVGDKNVDLICQRIQVPANHLLTFLQSGGFDANRTYKPGRDTRHRWFRDRWNIV